jgi:hypothetical protein
MFAYHRILVICGDRSKVPPVAGADLVAGCSQLACPELLAQDLLDAGDCFVDRLLGAYLGGRAAQQLLGNLGHPRELFRA